MMSYFVRYRGHAADAAAFARHYEDCHAAILQRFTGIRSLVLHQPVAWVDPYPVVEGKTFLLAQMLFDSPAALDTALKSAARAQAREDFRNFPTFTGEVTHEAMRGRVVF
jgi:uncharacterized protein (TIGR02118 family)